MKYYTPFLVPTLLMSLLKIGRYLSLGWKWVLLPILIPIAVQLSFLAIGVLVLVAMMVLVYFNEL